MKRRTVLRRGLGVAAVTVPLAGCSGGDNETEDDEDDGGDDSPDGSDSTPDGSDSTPGGSDSTPDSSESTPDDGDSTSTGNTSGVEGDIPGTAGSTPDGLEIVSTAGNVEINESDGEGEEDLIILVELENVGDKTTDATNYSYSAEVQNDAGETLSSSGGSWSPENAFTGEIDPGETITVQFIPILDGDPSTATEYTLSLECTDFWDGSYCS
jgi:hypothetical protein